MFNWKTLEKHEIKQMNNRDKITRFFQGADLIEKCVGAEKNVKGNFIVVHFQYYL